MSMTSDELKALAVALAEHMEPLVIATAKSAAALAGPVASAVATPVLDTVDQLVRAHNPSITQMEASAAPTVVGEQTLEQRVAALEVQVAALSAHTGAATSANFASTKAQIAAVAAPAKAA